MADSELITDKQLQKSQGIDHLISLREDEMKRLQQAIRGEHELLATDRVRRQREEATHRRNLQISAYNQEVDIQRRMGVVQTRERKVDADVSQIDARWRDLKTFESKAKDVISLQKQQQQDRIDIERMKREADTKVIEASSKWNKVTERIKALDAREVKVKQDSDNARQEQTAAEHRWQEAKTEQKVSESKIRHYEELKDAVDPKLVELDTRVKESEKAFKAGSKALEQANRMKADIEVTRSAVLEKERQGIEQGKFLAQKEVELNARDVHVAAQETRLKMASPEMVQTPEAEQKRKPGRPKKS